MYKNILITLVLSASLFGAGRPALVETTIVKEGLVNPLQEFVGTVSFSNNSQVAAKNSGLIEKVNFEIGQKVKKGQVLVKIDSDLIDAQIIAAQATLDIAKNEEINSNKDFRRYEKLLLSKSITQKEYDDALLKFSSNSGNVLALMAKLNELKIQKNRKEIKAPFSGVIVEKSVSLGEWVNAGSIVARLVDTSKLEIIFNAPISFIAGLRINDSYDLMLNNKSIKAKLMAAIAYGDKRTRTFPIKFKATVNNGFIFDGQEARVKLSKNATIKALMVPRDAVIKRFGANMIFLNNKGSALMLPVQILGYMGKEVAISAKGLKAGAQIVVKGNERVFPKQALQIINK